jgi:hypothetical protein
MPDEPKYIYLLLILIQIHAITSFDLIAVGVGLGIAAGSTLYAGWNKFACHFTECCSSSQIPYNFTSKGNIINAPGNWIFSHYI